MEESLLEFVHTLCSVVRINLSDNIVQAISERLRDEYELLEHVMQELRNWGNLFQKDQD